MARFHCDYCGYEQSVPQQYLDRTARCPECLHLSDVQSQPAAEVSVATSAPNRLRYWWLAALCGIILTIQGFTFRTTSMPEESMPENRIQSDAPTGTPLFAAEPPVALHQDLNPPIATSAVTSNQNSDRELKQPSKDSKSELAEQKLQPDQRDSTSCPAQQRGAQSPVANARVASEESEPDASHAPVVGAPVVANVGAPVVANNVKLILSHAATLDPDNVAEGKRLFEHEWKPHDKLAGKGDGLGPVFNARSCLECHFQGGTGGSGTNSHNVQAFEVLPDQDGGDIRDGVIHALANFPRHMETRTQLISDLGSPKVPFLQKRTNKTVELDAVRTLFINTPALWGNGLIDQITDDDLARLELTQHVTGRLRRLPDGQIGKFGWKSQISTLHQFVGSACAAELGLSNSVRSQQIPQAYEDNPAAKHDLTDRQVTSLVSFVANLPAPQQMLPTDAAALASIHEGQKLFSTVGCAHCHVPDVGPARGVYSDFRLHLIASSSFSSKDYYPPDSTPVYKPSASYAQLGEWKTPPLWGVADTAPYWHDGSALTLRDAILKHTEEGKDVKSRFERLDADQQRQLLTFLSTLKAPDVVH